MVYGQTGSGKSYTMEGYEYVMAERRFAKQYVGGSAALAGQDMRALIGNVSQNNEGVSTRFLAEFYQQLGEKSLKERNQYRFFVSMFQIYNEAIYDLLDYGEDALCEDPEDPFSVPLG